MGKAVQEIVWVAEDGTRFKTENDMLIHEGARVYLDHINEYIATIDFSDYAPRAIKAKQTQIRQVLLAYLAATESDRGEQDQVPQEGTAQAA